MPETRYWVFCAGPDLGAALREWARRTGTEAAPVRAFLDSDEAARHGLRQQDEFTAGDCGQ